mgnify:CR=1 FL=1
MAEHLDYRGRPRVQTINDLPSCTVQYDADQTDIKKIIGKYNNTGIIEHLNKVEATYADVSTFTDFADVMRHAKAAEAEFMKLPSKIREEFNHDVATWLDTSHDPEKRASLLTERASEPVAEPTPDPPAPAND